MRISGRQLDAIVVYSNGESWVADSDLTPEMFDWMTDRLLLPRSLQKVLDLVPIPGDDVLLYGGPAPSGDMRQPDDEPDTGGDPRPAGDL